MTTPRNLLILPLETDAPAIPASGTAAAPTVGIYQVAIDRVVDWPRDGIVLTPVKPVAIGTIHE